MDEDVHVHSVLSAEDCTVSFLDSKCVTAICLNGDDDLYRIVKCDHCSQADQISPHALLSLSVYSMKVF